MTAHFADLDRLLSSNAQWADDVGKYNEGFFQKLAQGQSPKVLWIGCADSRVPETVIMGCKPGDIFVHRNIANQFHVNDDSAQAVLAYAVQALGVEHIVVVGHTNCGGVHAAHKVATTSQSSSDTPLSRWLTPLVELAKSQNLSVTDLVEENVKAQVANVTANEVIQHAWAASKADGSEQKRVFVHGWVYGLETGRLRDLGVSEGPDGKL